MAWALLTQKRPEGGLGLVDPVRKSQVLHGKWIIKALSPSTFPWENFALAKLETVAAVTDGPTNIAQVLRKKPHLQFAGGSPYGWPCGRLGNS